MTHLDPDVAAVRTALAQGWNAMNELNWTHADIRAREALDRLAAPKEGDVT